MFATALAYFVATILGLVAIAVGGLHYLLPHPHDDPNRGLKRFLIILVTVAVFSAAMLGEYSLIPATSILTFTVLPFPQSTLQTCHVTWKQLLPLTAQQSTAPHYVDLDSKTKPGLQKTDLTVNIDGSTALVPLFRDAQAEFDQANATTTTVTPVNSYAGLADVHSGAVDIGLADFFRNDAPRNDPYLPAVYAYTELDDYLIAATSFTLIVNSDVQSAVWNLTTADVRNIFSGTIKNWHELGGPDEPISVLNRSAGSGTRINFEKLFGKPSTSYGEDIDESGDLVNAVASTPGAIGYTALSSVVAHAPAQLQQVAPLCLNGYGATATNITAGDYQFWSLEHAYTKTTAPNQRPATRDFLWYVCYGNFQVKDLLHDGFLPITQIPDALLKSHFQDYQHIQDCGAQWYAEVHP